MNKADDSVQSENIEPKETELLTKEQIKRFKEREKEVQEAEDCSSYRELADDIADENSLGDKEWAQEILENRKEDVCSDDEKWKGILSKILKENNIPKSDFQEIFKLKKIDLETESIKTLEPLRKFKNLTELSCSGTKITDLEPLRNLHNLTQLNCRKNQITDLEPLRGLRNLKILDIRGMDKITDLEPVRDLENLRK